MEKTQVSKLIVGIGQVTLLLRHSRSLKDKRQLLKSAETKLRNQGFSVVECGFQDNPRKASVGFCYAGRDVRSVELLLDEAFRLFEMGAEIAETQRDVFDYSEMKDEQFSLEPNERWLDEDDT